MNTPFTIDQQNAFPEIYIAGNSPSGQAPQHLAGILAACGRPICRRSAAADVGPVPKSGKEVGLRLSSRVGGPKRAAKAVDAAHALRRDLQGTQFDDKGTEREFIKTRRLALDEGRSRKWPARSG